MFDKTLVLYDLGLRYIKNEPKNNHIYVYLPNRRIKKIDKKFILNLKMLYK